MKLLILALAAGSCGYAQTRINLQTQSKAVDFANSDSTRPVKTGTVLPPACAAGELYFKRDAPPGENLYGCTATNIWMPLASGTAGATATPAPNVIPYSDFNGTLDAWMSVSARSFSFSGSTSWTVPGSTHQLGTCDLAWVVRDASGGMIWPNSFTCAPGTFDITANWAVNQTGRLSLVKSGGSGASGTGGGSGEWGGITGTISDQADLQAALNARAALSHTHQGTDIVAGTLATARLGTGSASSSTFLRGDGTWSAISGTAANAAGSIGQLQINQDGSTFGSRSVGSGLTMDNLNLAVDTSLIMDLGSTQNVTGNKTFTGNLTATGAGSNVDFSGANSYRLPQGNADPVCDATRMGQQWLNTNANPSVLKICGKNSSGAYAWGTATVTGW
jgi:hypothetical protein